MRAERRETLLKNEIKKKKKRLQILWLRVEHIPKTNAEVGPMFNLP